MTKPLTLAEMTSMGGHARAKSLTSEQRKNIASQAAKSRWKKSNKPEMKCIKEIKKICQNAHAQSLNKVSLNLGWYYLGQVYGIIATFEQTQKK